MRIVSISTEHPHSTSIIADTREQSSFLSSIRIGKSVANLVRFATALMYAAVSFSFRGAHREMIFSMVLHLCLRM